MSFGLVICFDSLDNKPVLHAQIISQKSYNTIASGGDGKIYIRCTDPKSHWKTGRPTAKGDALQLRVLTRIQFAGDDSGSHARFAATMDAI